MQVILQRTVVRMWFGILETHASFMLFLRWKNTCLLFSVEHRSGES